MTSIVQLLRYQEGEVLHAYPDHLGYWTIGVGRLIDQRKGGGISQAESGLLLSNDILNKERDLDQHITWWRDLSPVRRMAIVSMCFQMGINGLLNFKETLEHWEKGDYENAAKSALDSRWAKQTPIRAKEIAEMIRSETLPDAVKGG